MEYIEEKILMVQISNHVVLKSDIDQGDLGERRQSDHHQKRKRRRIKRENVTRKRDSADEDSAGDMCVEKAINQHECTEKFASENYKLRVEVAVAKKRLEEQRREMNAMRRRIKMMTYHRDSWRQKYEQLNAEKMNRRHDDGEYDDDFESDGSKVSDTTQKTSKHEMYPHYHKYVLPMTSTEIARPTPAVSERDTMCIWPTESMLTKSEKRRAKKSGGFLLPPIINNNNQSLHKSNSLLKATNSNTSTTKLPNI